MERQEPAERARQDIAVFFALLTRDSQLGALKPKCE
jgi:hypothetical protein